ncbi:MAG TPA: threonine/serine dehydratase [Vicinamibacteria bacterium]|nr:threonine/serine dehydratase [Vicinamibacteria bacterium]
MNLEEIAQEVQNAEGRIRPHVRETPLDRAPWLGSATGTEAHLKLEIVQLSGSFKLRGAMNKLLALSKAERDRGIVTASSGNHAAAVAFGLDRLGARGVIYLPNTVSKAKLEYLEAYGMELRFVGPDSVEGELEARRAGVREGLVYVSPYNDPEIIGGQGTVAVELERQLEAFDAVFVPVGGGGLVAGIAGYLKARRPSVRIYGCQPESSRVMYESVRAGRLVDLPSEPTLADGTAGGLDPGTITLPICQSVVDEWVLLSEDEIARAMRLVLEKHSILVEGAAALSVAACLKCASALRGKTVVLVLTGKKVSLDTLRRVLNESRSPSA